jgi:hypothetical protein
MDHHGGAILAGDEWGANVRLAQGSSYFFYLPFSTLHHWAFLMHRAAAVTPSIPPHQKRKKNTKKNNNDSTKRTGLSPTCVGTGVNQQPLPLASVLLCIARQESSWLTFLGYNEVWATSDASSREAEKNLGIMGENTVPTTCFIGLLWLLSDNLGKAFLEKLS